MSPRPDPLRNDIRRQGVLDLTDLVAQDQLALFQPLHLNQVGAGRQGQGRNRGVEVAVFLLQARQLLAQCAFVVVVHLHRWFATRRYQVRRLRNNYRVFHSAFKAPEKLLPIKYLPLRMLPGEPRIDLPLRRVCARLISIRATD